ncbi:MAG: sensor histidine kinase [Spirochaetaceae bacterium]|nr:MAG: sensor histidine kinase [Spirochaetaceae bacterium]
MKSAEIPDNEQLRLAKLHSYHILDTLPEKEYNDIVQLIAAICKTPIADISLVDENRQWFKAQVGLKDQQTSRDIAFCAHTILGRDMLIIEDAAKDQRFADNPLVLQNPNIRFYAGMPLITPEGYAIGSLCAIDTKPRVLSQEQKDALKVLAGYVVNLLELRLRDRKLAERNTELERINNLKDRLISIIAHDIKAPLNQFDAIVRLIEMDALDEQERQESFSDLRAIANSTTTMLENLLQWASRLISSDSIKIRDILFYSFLQKVTAEIQSSIGQKKNTIEFDFAEDCKISSDPDILHFVLRNLIVNANKFTSNGTITIGCKKTASETRISVCDTGIGFDTKQIVLFDPERKQSSLGTSGEKGSGLGLIFCNDFIEKLGGQICYDSQPSKGSTFTIILPENDISGEPT